MGARISTALAVTSAGALALYMLLSDHRAALRLGAFAVALLALGALLLQPAWRRALPLGVALVVSAALLVVAVAARPNGTDLWYYQLYGRIVVHYHDSPYKHEAAHYAGDAVLARTGGIWDHQRAEYGPVLVAVAAGVAAVTGTSELAARLAWQGLAALAVFLALVLIARRTRSAAAVAAVGLNPVIAYSVVNGGHNDALIGLAVLAAALLATRDRDTLAALALTAAVLIKAPVGLALVAFLLWLVYRKGLRRALPPAGAAAAVGLGAVLAAGGRAALEPMLGASSRTNRFTVWNLFRTGGLEPFRGHGYANLGPVGDVLPTLAVVAAVALSALLVAARLRDRQATVAIGAALAGWLLLSLYTTPWSFGWVLPVLALRRGALVTKSMLVFAAITVFSTQWGTTTDYWLLSLSSWFHFAEHALGVLTSLTVVTALGLTALLATDAVRRLTRAKRPARPASAPVASSR